MALDFPWQMFAQAQQNKNQNQQQMYQNIAGLGQGLGQIGQTVGSAVDAYKKQKVLDQLAMAIRNQGAPQQGPQMPVDPSTSTVPTSGMGAPGQDNTNLIQSLMTQYSPQDTIQAMQKKMTERPTSPWVVVPSMLTKNGRPVQQNKETGAVREASLDVTPTGRGNAAFGAGSVGWDSATDEEKNLAKALYEGRVRPFDLSYRDRGTSVKLANQYALTNGLPAYKSYAGDVAGATAKSFATGKPAMNTLSLNTALGHLDTANDAYEAVKNTNVAWLNKPLNVLKKNTNDPNIIRLTTALNAVRGEAANVFKGNGATDQEIKSWDNALNENLTPAQAQGTIQMLDELFRSRLKALEYMRQNGMGGRAEGNLLSPKAAAISKKIGAGTKTGGLTPDEQAELATLEQKYGGK